AQLAGRLKAARRAFSKLDVSKAGLKGLEAGLAKVYRDCRLRFADAYELDSDEAFHEWRKTVQQHWRHMRLLLPAWPEMMHARVKLPNPLSDLLGEDHDLSLLLPFLEDNAEKAVPKSEAAHIRKLARARQQAIRSTAKPLGSRLLAQSERGLPR